MTLDLKPLILNELRDHQPHRIGDLVKEVAQRSGAYESDIRFTLLNLVRRNELIYRDDFRIQLGHGVGRGVAMGQATVARAEARSAAAASWNA